MRLHALLLAAGVAATCGLPAAMAAPDVETFEWSTMTSKGRLGVMVTGLTPELRTYFGTDKDRGVLVARVEERSAAATAGLRVGDVIVEVRGHKIEDGADVIAALALFGIDEIGVEIEDPFGDDPNDLPLDAIGTGIEKAVGELVTAPSLRSISQAA